MIKRRTICRYLSAAVTGGVLAAAAQPTSAMRSSLRRWALLYWMPYDNDLSRFCDPILEMLRQGTAYSNSIVLVQADRFEVTTMQRYVIQAGEIQEFSVEAEDSSDVTALEDYLDWANRVVSADHWMVAVVGHGGNVAEISPDSQGRRAEPWRWMRLDQFCRAVHDFHQRTAQGIELLYFQNCNRGTLETFYEARHCARYTLASQLLLGAPNGYYQAFLRRLDGLETGQEAAIAIMDTETLPMFHSLTLVDNRAAELLPTYLSPLLQQVTIDSPLSIDLRAVPVDIYGGDRHYDALMLLTHLTQQAGRGTAALDRFQRFVQSSLIAAYRNGGELYSNPLHPAPIYVHDLSGIGVAIPLMPETLTDYQHLALYSAVDLESFYRLLLNVA